ncbi:hypothetical protein KCU61_g673, partial [Aureobasidium melanogenum]
MALVLTVLLDLVFLLLVSSTAIIFLPVCSTMLHLIHAFSCISHPLAFNILHQIFSLNRLQTSIAEVIHLLIRSP